jgi:transposase InsO family protein
MKRTINFIKTLLSKFNLIANLTAKNLALQQQLIILNRSIKRPQIKTKDRLFWIILFLFWKNWQDSLIVLKPETVVGWHKKGFRLFWRWKSRSKSPGRPRISQEIRNLIYKMAMANPLWGAPRIHGELLKLGINISERTVSGLMPKHPRKPSSQTWRAFIKNHMTNTVSIDFFTVPTVTFRILFVIIILKNNRRKVIHFNTTEHPTAQWTAQQIVEAFPWDTVPKYLIRDRDSIYGSYFRQRVKNMGITEVLTAPRSPWQNPYAERLIGSIRRECLNHVIVLSEKHLLIILSSYFKYYNQDRTHCGLNKDVPIERLIQPKPFIGSKVIKLSRVGGLHNRYQWKEAA